MDVITVLFDHWDQLPSGSTEITGKIPLQTVQVGTFLGMDFLVWLVFCGVQPN